MLLAQILTPNAFCMCRLKLDGKDAGISMLPVSDTYIITVFVRLVLFKCKVIFRAQSVLSRAAGRRTLSKASPSSHFQRVSSYGRAPVI